MRIQQYTLQLKTTGKTLHNITDQLSQLVQQSGMVTGVCGVFLQHSSASLIIQENADPDVLQDLEDFFRRLIPEDVSQYRHSAEGADDMPAHIRTALTSTSENIPIQGGKLALGTWQGVYVWEHRQRGRQRQVLVNLMGL
jgi:secondary thiamine-phosphate synthase enzyme